MRRKKYRRECRVKSLQQKTTKKDQRYSESGDGMRRASKLCFPDSREIGVHTKGLLVATKSREDKTSVVRKHKFFT